MARLAIILRLSLWFKIVRKVTALGLVPRSRLARFAAYLAAIDLLLVLLNWVLKLAGKSTAATSLPGWINFLGLLVGVLVLLVALRWFRRHVMWRLRNQLLVTYLFIGAVPITLVITMTLFAGGRFFGQFATFLTVSEIQSHLQRLAATNSAAAEQITRHGAAPEEIAAHNEHFPGCKVSISEAPKWLQESFSGLVIDQGHFYLRAVDFSDTRQNRKFVTSTVPLDEKLLGRIASGFGSLTLSYYEDNGADNSQPSPDPRPYNTSGLLPSQLPVEKHFTSGTIPAARNFLDREFDFAAYVPVVDWSTGKKEGKIALLAGTTRPSLIYMRLSEHLGDWTDTITSFVVVSAGLFFLMVLVALFIGLRLTRAITASVANLYEATQRINRGDFTHRIEVKQNDQLAALQVAFNSMTASLQKLIAEQKEKERLQSELEIAHEVQAQLFPRDVTGTARLELHGVCRPARIVSGDYYDFLPFGPDRFGIAVGDISGKGISAALLMATIHSAVRAYEQDPLVAADTAVARSRKSAGTALAEHRTAPSPARMLQALNRHLFRSTQMEKYATLFLGFYDGENHRMTYSNAGHLPPIILAPNGSVRRLDAGGMVVGLFDNIEYEEQTVDFNAGDIFIAFSDGITEPENEFGEFGEERLVETVAIHRYLSLQRITDQVIAAVHDWIGSTEPPDDITLVLARRAE